ncbi:MAG: ABC transporter substrate-binding protein [Xanthobacteraceae bacterium]
MAIKITRRKIIAALGSSAAWQLAARAQQPALPVIGYLGSQSATSIVSEIAALKDGLKETGFTVGQNVQMEFLWADDQYDRLPAMAVELVHRQVAVIVAGGGNVSALAAKAATTTIPIVFPIVTDPVKGGLVASLNRPGGNLTGIAAMTIELDPKRLELLCDLLPRARVIGALIDSNRPEADEQVRSLQTAAQALGRQMVVAKVAAEGEFENATAALVSQKADAIVVGASPLFNSRRDTLIAATARHAVPTIYQFREFAESGGLITYGASAAGSYRQAGIYVGRILKGEKPADLPVVQPIKFDLVINLKTAKTLDLNVPQALLATADEVIE